MPSTMGTRANFPGSSSCVGLATPSFGKEKTMTTINTPSEAIVEALAQDTNDIGMCQQVTRNWYNAPSAGDQDKDGDFDAVDGWLSEPAEGRHPNDRSPRIGYPVSYVGGDGVAD